MPFAIKPRLIRDLVVRVMAREGTTVAQIEEARGRVYEGDAGQEAYRDEPVWHTKKAIDAAVAEKLRLNASAWGPDRKSNDFQTSVSTALSGMARRGQTVPWNSGRRYSIWRLEPAAAAAAAVAPAPDLSSREGILSAAAEAQPAPASGEDMMREFLSILRHGNKDNTYKFALARALLDYSTGRGSDGALEVPYEYLADKFLEYYWHQECKLRLKQDSHKAKSPKAIQAIRRVWGANTPGSFELLDNEDKAEARSMILRDVFGHARSKTSLVVPRFQKIKRGGVHVKADTFYDYSDDDQMICLKPKALEFLRANHVALRGLVTLEWAKFLEAKNPLLPMMVAKVEKYEASRGSLAPVRRSLLEHSCHCFYCRSRLERRRTDVDHLIPWSYMFSDSWWNLVLACRRCNGKKSDSLPQDEFLDSLVRRNRQYEYRVKPIGDSLAMLNVGRGWETEIRGHYDTCREYGFCVVNLP